MSFLETKRLTLNRLLPGLEAALAVTASRVSSEAKLPASSCSASTVARPCSCRSASAARAPRRRRGARASRARRLRAVAAHGLYIASGFAEGRSGADILDARMRAEPVDGGYAISGSKKPCSLSRPMTVLTWACG